MKILFGMLLGTLMCIGVFGQAEQNTDPGVEEISLAQDDGSGKPGEAVYSFFTTDIPIHCLIKLSSNAAVVVKMNLSVVKAAGEKAGASVVAISYKTTGTQNKVAFNASPDGSWSPGRYRIDVSLDGKPAKSLEFEIQQAVQETNSKSKMSPKPIARRGKTNVRFAGTEVNFVFPYTSQNVFGCTKKSTKVVLIYEYCNNDGRCGKNCFDWRRASLKSRFARRSLWHD